MTDLAPAGYAPVQTLSGVPAGAAAAPAPAPVADPSAAPSPAPSPDLLQGASFAPLSTPPTAETIAAAVTKAIVDSGALSAPTPAVAVHELVATAIADAKPFLKSRTVWSIVVAALASVGAKYGHPIGSVDQASLVTDILAILQYGGLSAAVVFRVLARSPLA